MRGPSREAAASLRVAVVGGGAAGLVTAVELAEAGAEPVVYEAGPSLGGVWRYDERTESDLLSLDPKRTIVHSSMYDSLRTNLPRDLMAFRRFPFESAGGAEGDDRRFPGRREVLAYLERFAASFGVEARLQLGTRVESVMPMASEGPWERGRDEPTHWRVETTGPDGKHGVAEYDAVAICNGHYTCPHVPSLPGFEFFRGRAMHSHNYRRPEIFSGMRVALLGARASGVDLAVEIARHASHVCLCDRGATGTERFAGLERAVRRSAIARITRASDLVLEDGGTIEGVDWLIFCTGYEFSFPFLRDGHGVIAFEQGSVHPLYWDVIAARASTLAFIGLPSRIVPFPLFELQARLFAQTLIGACELPDAAVREAAAVREIDALRTQGIPSRHVLTYGNRQFAYCDRLADATGTPRFPPSFEALHRAVEAARRDDILGYRDASYARVDPPV